MLEERRLRYEMRNAKCEMRNAKFTKIEIGPIPNSGIG